MTQDPMQDSTTTTTGENTGDQPESRRDRRTDAKGRKRRKAGVLEALVAMSILVSLSGVLMPAVSTRLSGARAEEAILDMQRIASGIAQYSQQTLTYPTGKNGRTNVACLYGPGSIPSSSFGQGSESRPLEDVLMTNAMGGDAWAGPYVDGLQADPWGNAYLVNAEGWVLPGHHAMIVSAGPDGIVQTTSKDIEAAEDDILLIVD
jgi:type II secretory pathway pseudopilin PulG